MGLKITAYSQVKFLRSKSQREEVWKDSETWLYRANGFVERMEPLEEGMYSFGEEFDFIAGSYSGYNNWRSNLADMMGTTDQAAWEESYNGPFHLLINFSDCEGTLGTEACVSLKADFDLYAEKARVFAESIQDGEYWLEKYLAWQKAFTLAADQGAVKFH